MSTNPETYVYQSATVIAVDSAVVTLATIRLSTCQQCIMKAGCGHRLLNQTENCEKSHIQLAHPQDRILQVGSEVTIAVPQNTFLLASLWLFLVPLLVMLVFALGVQIWVSHELYVAVSGLLGLGLGLLFMRMRIKRLQETQLWQPFVVESNR